MPNLQLVALNGDKRVIREIFFCLKKSSLLTTQKHTMSLYFIENNSVAYEHLLAELSLQWQFMRKGLKAMIIQQRHI